MKRVFFGLLALGAGVGALHFLGRWLQIRDSTACNGDARCQQRVQWGGESRRDREKTIGLFLLAGFAVWQAGGRDHG